MRITLAQINTTVGDVAGNTELILDAMARAERDGASVLVSCELTVCGSPPRDLLFRAGFVEACEAAVQMIAERTGDLHVIVGHPRRVAHGVRPYRNSASVCHRGEVTAVYDKRLLPGYDVFDDDRYFDAGEELVTFDVEGRRLGLLICEDLWRGQDAVVDRGYGADLLAQLARAGCDVLLSLNASPFVRGKGRRHLDIVRKAAQTHEIVVAAVNQVGGNDDLVFDGRSVVVDATGAVRAMLPAFESAVETVDIDAPPSQSAEPEVTSSGETFAALVCGVRDYFVKTGHREAIIGLSGGIDSALTAVVAAKALGPESVTGLMMPSRYSTAGSRRDALALIENLGLNHHEVSIEDAHAIIGTALTAMVGDRAAGLPDENVQARLRGLLLMAYSNAAGGLVLATGNKSELAVGYSTLYGDMCGAVSVLGDVLKTTVYELSRWINDNAASLGFDAPPIPQATIDKPPSAELRPDQTDQDTLPDYEDLDEIITRYVDGEQAADEIAEQTGLDPDTVARWTRQIDIAQYKRDQASVILKVTRRAFGRGRPMPIVMSFDGTAKLPGTGLWTGGQPTSAEEKR